MVHSPPHPQLLPQGFDLNLKGPPTPGEPEPPREQLDVEDEKRQRIEKARLQPFLGWLERSAEKRRLDGQMPPPQIEEECQLSGWGVIPMDGRRAGKHPTSALCGHPERGRCD